MTDKYQAFDPNVEIMGAMMLAFAQCANNDSTLPLLAKHGLTDIQPDRWYPVQAWLDVLSDIVNTGGDVYDLIAIGKRIGEISPLPPTVKTVVDALPTLGMSFAGVHRNGNAGTVVVRKITDEHWEIDHHTPWPDELMFGAAFGIVYRFLSSAHNMRVSSNMATVQRFPRESDEHLIVTVQWG